MGSVPMAISEASYALPISIPREDECDHQGVNPDDQEIITANLVSRIDWARFHARVDLS
jgi:hypothetical protein